MRRNKSCSCLNIKQTNETVEQTNVINVQQYVQLLSLKALIVLSVKSLKQQISSIAFSHLTNKTHKTYLQMEIRSSQSMSAHSGYKKGAVPFSGADVTQRFVRLIETKLLEINQLHPVEDI